MKHSTSRAVLLSLGAALGTLILGAAISYAATSAVALQTVANVTHLPDQTAIVGTTTANATAGVNDQTLTIGTTTANVPQVKASRTLTVSSVPAAYNASTTIGSCVITYSTSTADSLNCTANTATVNTTTHATATSLATALASLTNIGSSNGHGPLTVSSSTATTVTISTAGTEASSTPIAFIDGTSNAVISSASTSGTVPVAEVLTLTPGGTVDPGDVFTVTNPTATFTVSHTVPGTATTTSGEANGIANSLIAYSGYGSIGFTVATSSGMDVLTSTVPGTPFYIVTTAVNRPALAQLSTVTIGGTADVGDVFTLNILGGAINYTTVASDTSSTSIAMDLNTALHATSTYASLPFTASSTGSVLSFLAKTPGTGFTLTAATTNAAPVAQVVTFTFPSISTNTTYYITLNGNNYSYTAASAAAIASGLATGASGDAAVTCTASGSVLTCTANVAGTPFTYSTNASDVTISSSGGGGGGGGSSGGQTTVRSTTTTTSGSSTQPTVVTTTSSVPVTVSTSVGPVMVGGAAKVTGSLKYSSQNSSVKALQQLLMADPALGYTGGVTGYFGLKTKAAVELFQTTYAVATASDAGYGIVGPKTRAALVRVYGK